MYSGGGGGGWYGGGGGSDRGGSGGGGSSYCSGITLQNIQAARGGDGAAVISWSYQALSAPTMYPGSALLPATMQTFSYTGGLQTFTVTADQIAQGCSSLQIKLFGAGAQDKVIGGTYYGKGGRGGAVIALHSYIIYIANHPKCILLLWIGVSLHDCHVSHDPVCLHRRSRRVLSWRRRL